MRFTSSLASLILGTLVTAQTNYSALPVPYLVTNNPVTPLPQGFPWGTKTANNTNPYTNPPITGVTRVYDFTIKKEQKAPDGVLRDVIIINGQFPGPLIEANWGDTIQVTVHNKIPDEGTSLHWHGILQKTSQWEDGVPGVSQCPIPPNSTFTYSFLADLYGTSWYHSHYSAQYNAGILGPMIIHGPETVPYDIDVGPIVLTDWYHKDYYQIVEDTVSNCTDLCFLQTSDSNLIQGRPNGTTFRFTPGKKHRLRLINAGSEGMQKFTIDGHNMTIIANDFVPVEPYQSQVVTLGIGQRTDVIVTGLPNATGEYWMRSNLSDCSLKTNAAATGVVYYLHEDLTKEPTTQPWPAWVNSVENICANDPLTDTVPWFPILPETPTVTETITINFTTNATGNHLWTMNDSSFRANYNDPILLLSNLGNNSYPDDPQWNVYNFGSNTSIRIVLNNLIGAAHPIHLHGHNFFVIDEGVGTWDGTTVINPSNPQRRDVQILQGNGYMVLQITADNPGAWPLHCHIAWHVSAGLYVTVLERPADIKNLKIPSVVAQTCRDWATFTGEGPIDQIDSGL
jgi:FtsP/CotA-like multicopper oxidase with cupredoxin domain